jgi:superfamily II DNA/RNA helicase
MLVTPDLISRGLDGPDVPLVVNYSVLFPAKSETYFQRISLCGGFGRKGIAVSLLTAEETEIMHEMQGV